MRQRKYATQDDRPASPATSRISVREWRKIKEACGNRCAYCGNPNTRLCIEHVQPLSRGGEDTVDNILASCPSCNSSKGDLFLLEWAMVQTWTWERIGVGNSYRNLRARTPDDGWFHLTPRIGDPRIRYGDGTLKVDGAA